MSSTTSGSPTPHAFITGGGSGIGLACAAAFARDGAIVTIVGRDTNKLSTAVAALQQDFPDTPGIYSQRCDVADEQSVIEAVEAAQARAQISIGVANAGMGGLSQSLQTTSADWQQILQTNLTGTFYTFKHLGQAMRQAPDRRGGALCAISSIAGLRTHRFMSAYCVSKAGIDSLVRNLADELGEHGIRVNSVCPGLVDTDIASGLIATPPVHEDYLSCMPLGRTGVVADIAAAVRFLCSPLASWITGAQLPVDGGHHLRRGPNLDLFANMIAEA